MNEHDKARPVSGEIMTGSPAPRDLSDRRGFSDAEFETVKPVGDNPARRFGTPRPATGMDFLKQTRHSTPDADPRGGALFWATGITLVVLAFWVSGGHEVARQAMIPQAEVQQALRIADVRSRIERQNGRDILFVDGRAENHDGNPRKLPGIEIVVFATDGTSTRYLLGTNATELKPGERYAFSSRLEAPANGVKTVAVTFQEGPR